MSETTNYETRSEEPEEIKGLRNTLNSNQFGIFLENICGAIIVGINGFILGQDNLPGYGQAISGATTMAGGFMVFHSTIRALERMDNLYNKLKDTYKKD